MCTTFLIPAVFLAWFGFADAIPATFVSALAGDYKIRSPTIRSSISLMSMMIMILSEEDILYLWLMKEILFRILASGGHGFCFTAHVHIKSEQCSGIDKKNIA